MDVNMASPLASPRHRTSALPGTGGALSPTAKARRKSVPGSEESKFLEIQSIAKSLHKIAAELNEVQPNSPGGKRAPTEQASQQQRPKGSILAASSSRGASSVAPGQKSSLAAEPGVQTEDANAAPALRETDTVCIPSRPRRSLVTLVDKPEDSSMDGESSDSVAETVSEKSFASDMPEVVFDQGEDTEDFDAAQWYGTVIDHLDKLKVKDEWAAMSDLRKRFIRTDPRRADDMERLQTLSNKRINEGESIKREMALIALDLEEAMSKLLIQLNGFDHSLQRTAEEVEEHRVMMEKRSRANAGISFDGINEAYKKQNSKKIWDEDLANSDSDKWDGEVKVKERPMKKIAQSKAGVLLGEISKQQNDVTEQAVKAAQLSKRLQVMREAHAHMHSEGRDWQEDASKEVNEAIQNVVQQIQRRKELEQKHAHAKMLAELAVPSATYTGIPEAPKDAFQEVAMLKSRVRDLDAEMAQFGGGHGQASASISKLMGSRRGSMRRSLTDASMGGVDSMPLGASKSVGGGLRRRSSRLRFEETFRESRQTTEELQEQVNKVLMKRATLMSEKAEQEDVLTEMQGEKGIMQQSFFEADRLRAKWAAIGALQVQQPAGFRLSDALEEQPPDANGAATQERAEWQLHSAELERLLGVPPPSSLEEGNEMRVKLEQDMARKRTQVRSLSELLAKVAAKQDILQQSRARQEQAKRQLEAAQQKALQEARGAGSGGAKGRKSSTGDSDDAVEPPPATIAPEHEKKRRSSLKGLMRQSSMLAMVMRPPPGTVVAEDGTVSIAGQQQSRQSRVGSVHGSDGEGDEDGLVDMSQLRGMVPQDDGQEGSAELVAHILSLQANLEELHFQQVDYETATTYLKHRGGADGLIDTERALVMSMIDGDQKKEGSVTKADLAACMVSQAVLHKRLQELRRKFREKMAAEKAEAKQAAITESETEDPMDLPTEGIAVAKRFSIAGAAATMQRVKSRTLPVAALGLFNMDAEQPKTGALPKSVSDNLSASGSGDRGPQPQRRSIQGLAQRLATGSGALEFQRRVSEKQTRGPAARGLFEKVLKMRQDRALPKFFQEVMPDVMHNATEPQDGMPPRRSSLDQLLASVQEDAPLGSSALSGRGSSLASMPPGGPLEDSEGPLTPVFRRLSTGSIEEEAGQPAGGAAIKRILLEEKLAREEGYDGPAVATAQSLPTSAMEPFFDRRRSSEGSEDEPPPGPAVRSALSAPDAVRRMLNASRATAVDNNRNPLSPGVSPKRRKRRRSLTNALLKVDDSDDDAPEEGKEASGRAVTSSPSATTASATMHFAAVQATLSKRWSRVPVDATAGAGAASSSGAGS